MDKLLEVKDLRVSYHTYAGEVQSVRGITFAVAKGETIAIVGESGCGKSVTAKTLLRLIKTPPGEIKAGSQILWQGEDVLKFNEKRLSTYRGGECSIVFQDALAALNPTMPVGRQIAENLCVHKGMSKKEAFSEAVSILKLVGIPNAEQRAKQYPHEFSGGMRQRAMIAIAFACRPQMLVADEPTTALDVTIQAQIIDLLKVLQKEMGTSIILITHDFGVVANIATRILVMYCGKIVESGSNEDIFYRPRHPYTLALLEAAPRLDMRNKQELYTIDGIPPDLISPPQGCPFSTRCRYCMEICCEELPEAANFGGEHQALCWLHDPGAPKDDSPFTEKG